MRNYGKISIQKKTQSQWLIWFIFFLSLLSPGMIQLLSLPDAVKYLMDICWCMLLVLLYLNQRRIRSVRSFYGWVVSFFCFAVLTYVFRYQSLFYLLWGFRNNFRFYVLFLAVACFLRQGDTERYVGTLDTLFWINAVLSLYQFFVLGHQQDYLGGLFGVEHGSNGYTNIILVVYLAKTTLWYLNGREKAGLSFTKIAICMVIAAMAELKFYFVEAALVVALCSLITRFTWRKLLIILFAVMAVFVGIYLLLLYFPGLSGFFQIESLWESATSDKGYTSSGDLNRLNAITRISNELMDSSMDRLFGLGLGNCDTAAYSFLQTPFNTQYSYLHYTWLSTAFIFLEMGWVGLAFFFGFFWLVYRRADILRKQGGENQIYCQLAMVTAVMCMAIAVYNSSLRTEAGYLAYFVMALPFVRQENVKKENGL